jgi:ABC-type sugar transport system permease subunit
MYKGRRRLIVLFLAPSLLLYAIFFLWPAAQSVRLSFFEWSGIGEETYVGLRNFKELLSILDVQVNGQFPFIHPTYGDAFFWPSVGHTLINVFLGGLLTFGLAFMLTAFLSSGIRGKKFFRMIIFAPNVIAAIALSLLWAQIYNPRHGLLKNFFDMLGMENLAKTAWLGPDLVLFATLVAMVWVWVGFNLILLLAAVDQIPQDMFDAAKVDGANTFYIFTKITIPLTWEVLTIAVINFGIVALKVFEFPFIIKGLQTPPQLYTLAIYNFVLGFGRREPIWRMGKAAAVAVLMQIMVIVMIAIFARIFRRETVQYN